MKLLLDENLSDKIVPQILDLFPNSAQLKQHALLQADDTLIWSFAQQQGFTLISKDSDFHQRSLVFGHPPKFVFLRVGNCPTRRIVELIRHHTALLSAFDADQNASVLVLPQPPHLWRETV